MQEHTKEQDLSRTRRSNPLHIVQGTRLPSANADALRDVHMSLVRAEQNLFNLVQASQSNANHVAPSAGFNYPATNGLASSYPTGFAPGFALPAALHGQSVAPFGSIQSPLGAAQIPATAWSPLGVNATGAPANGFASNAFASQGLAAAGAYAPIGIAGALAPAGIVGVLACDIVDEGKQFVCQVDLPGLQADQIEVFCSERTVVVTAYPEIEADSAILVQSERTSIPVQRTLWIPNEILPAGVKTTLAQGVLSIVLPKARPTEGPRRVKIQG